MLSVMGTVYFIRHGQRFPMKQFPQLESAFSDEPVVDSALTRDGRTRMRQLGATFKNVPIVKARSSDVQRCHDSLEEFLKGADCQVQAEPFGDRTFKNLADFVSRCDVTPLRAAFDSSIRKRSAFDALNDEYFPNMEKSLKRDIFGGAVVDAFAILDDRGVQKMTDDMADLNLDLAVMVAEVLRHHFRDAIQKTLREAFDDQNGHTVACVSDMHILYVLQRLAPQLVKRRPAFGSILKMSSSDDRVLLHYDNQTVDVSSGEFWEKLALDKPPAHT